jgi:uncharacterized membrane protein
MKISSFEIITFAIVITYAVVLIWTIYRLVKSKNTDLMKFGLILLTVFLPIIGLFSSLIVLSKK